MGVTRKILAERTLHRDPIFYSDSLRIDLSETFHLHVRNTRLTFSPREWIALARGLRRAYIEWRLLGRPPALDADGYMPFVTERLPLLTGEDFERARQDELAIELQQQTDYVHVHYRALRLELTLAEFDELAGALEDARQELRRMPEIADAPRRLGIRHGSNPHGRVTRAGNAAGFWLDHTEMKSYRSVIRDSAGGWREQLPFQKNSGTAPRWRLSLLRILQPMLKLIFG